MTKPTFSLPIIMDARTTKQLLDDEVNRYGGLIYDGSIAAASDPTLAQQVADDVAASASAAQQSAEEAALYEGPWLDGVAALLADTTLTYTADQPGTVAEGDYVRTRAEGFSYEVAASAATDHHVTTAGGVKLRAIINGGVVFLEQLGVTDGIDISGALALALELRPARIETKSALSFTTTSVSRDLRATGVDHPSLVVDLKGSTITKTGSHAYATIRTEGIVNFDCYNTTINCANLAAVGWYAISNRTELVGHAVFHNCHVRNCLQVSGSGGGASVGFRVAGAMQRAAMLGGSIHDVTADAGVSGKITRGFWAGSNFGLSGQRNFPLLVECLGSDIRRITPDDNGDGVFAIVEDTAPDKEKSRLVVRKCYFEDCAKRSVKSQYWDTTSEENTFAHTVNAPTGIGREEVSFQRGGGSSRRNKYRYAGTGRPFLYDGRSTDQRGNVSIFAENDIKVGGGSISRAITGSEFLAGGSFSPGVIAEDNTVTGATLSSFIRLRPGSRSSGVPTTGSVRLNGNEFDGITGSLIELDRGPSVSGDTSAFFARFEKLSVSGNINRGASVPLVSFGVGDPTGANITVLDEVFGENRGFDFVSKADFDVVNGVVVNRSLSSAIEFDGADPKFQAAQFSMETSGLARRGILFSANFLTDNFRSVLSSNYRRAFLSVNGEVGAQQAVSGQTTITGYVDAVSSFVDGITAIAARLEYSDDSGSTWRAVETTRAAATAADRVTILIRIVLDVTATAPGSFGNDRRYWRITSNINANPFNGGVFDNLDAILID